MAAEPSEPDIELAPTGDGPLHCHDCRLGEDPRMSPRIEVQVEEARGFADGADQAAVGGALDAKTRQHPELPTRWSKMPAGVMTRSSGVETLNLGWQPVAARDVMSGR